MSASSVAARLQELRQEQETLFAEAKVRRTELLAELADICKLVGPVTRDDVPEGVLRRRRRRAAKAAPRPRRGKIGTPAQTAEEAS